MNKIRTIFILLLYILATPGCGNENVNDIPVALKEITGDISIVSLDQDGDIIIDKDDITEELRYYSYEYEGVTIGLFAVKDSIGNTRILINTCGSCGGSPYAYFVQVGNKIQCQNCGSLFDIDSLGELTTYGCNPISIESLEDIGAAFKISHTEIEQYKEIFENWEGPKA